MASDARDEIRQRLRAALDAGSSGVADADPAVRRVSIWASADPELLRAGTTDPDPGVRKAALDRIGADPALAATCADLLASALASATEPDRLCREAAAFALGEAATPDAPGLLVAAAADETEPVVREAIVAALGALGDPATLPVVLAMTTREKPSVRRRAVVALAAFDDPSADAAIRAALDDRDRFVREAAEWLVRDEP